MQVSCAADRWAIMLGVIPIKVAIFNERNVLFEKCVSKVDLLIGRFEVDVENGTPKSGTQSQRGQNADPIECAENYLVF